MDIPFRAQGNSQLSTSNSQGLPLFFILIFFFFFFLIYIASSSGHLDPWDGTEYYFITESMALKHSLKLYPDLPSIEALSTKSLPDFLNSCHTCEAIDEPTYILRSLLSPAIAVPWYYLAVIFNVPPMELVALTVNSLLISLTCLVLYSFSLRLYQSERIALVLTLIFGVCSFIWPYNSSLMSEPSKTLCIFGSAYFIYLLSSQPNSKGYSLSNHHTSSIRDTTVVTAALQKDRKVYLYVIAALLLGLSVVSHPSSLIIVPGFVLYYFISIRSNRRRRRRKLLAIFMLVLAGVLLLVGYTNYVRFGSFEKFGPSTYDEATSLSVHQGWQGIIGLLISPGRGLFFYFPIAILFPFSLVYMYKKDKSIFFLCIYTFSAFWLFYGTLYFPTSTLSPSDTWSGGWWGPRYIVPLLPFIALSLGTLFEYLKGKLKVIGISAIIVLSIAGFLVNLLGVLVWWQFANVYEMEELGETSQEVKTWNPYESFIVKHLEILLSGYVSQVQQIPFSYTSYSLAPCQFDNYLYCKHGFGPILALGMVIVVLGLLILVIIGSFRRPNSFAAQAPIRNAVI